VRTKNPVVYEIANERQLFRERACLLPVELRLTVALNHRQQVKLIRSGEILRSREQALWHIPSVAVDCETDGLIASVPLGLEAIREALRQVSTPPANASFSGGAEQREVPTAGS